MTHPTPTLSVDVDVTNPGQFFACCGLLELATRLDPEALGWFSEPAFHLRSDGADVLQAFSTCTIAPHADAVVESEAAPPSPPVQLGPPFEGRLDWWLDDAAVRAGFKTWSGGQTVMGFIDGMREQMRENPAAPASVLRDTFPISKPKPFCFDGRLSRLTALDMGFSTEKFTASFSPAAELLTLVGLQRFRPATVVHRERYGYHTWADPLPAGTAAAAAHGLTPSLSHRAFTFPLVVRTGGKYKAFGPATPA